MRAANVMHQMLLNARVTMVINDASFRTTLETVGIQDPIAANERIQVSSSPKLQNPKA